MSVITAPRLRVTLAIAAAWLFGVAAAQPAAEPAVREAHKAWRERDAHRLDAAAAALRAHPLAVYTQYWQVMLSPEDQGIRKFLERHDGTVLAERLREDWVRGIARRGDWALLTDVHRGIESPSGNVACWALRARAAQRDATAAADLLRTQWLQPHDLPEGCRIVVNDMVTAGQIAPAAVWQRARNLVAFNDAGAARRLLASLPSPGAPSARQLDLALGAPQRWFDAANLQARSATERERIGELSALALARLANADTLRAISLLQQHRERLAPAQRAYVHAQLGLQAARRLEDDANAWFALTGAARPADLTDEHRAWWARAALRTQRWGDVRTAIDGMSTASRNEARWTYWLGRATAALGDAPRAQALWQRVAREQGADEFYDRLAHEALGAPRAVDGTAWPSKAQIDAVARDPGVVRAVLLQRSELFAEASSEWQWAMRKFDPARLAAASRYAQQLGFWNRALDSAERSAQVQDPALRYPTPYLTLVQPAAKQAGVDEALVYGVMRRESRFSAGASSTAGARGLMQVMPSTGRWLAQGMGWPQYQDHWLGEPQRNITLGARYLRQLRSDLGGSAVMAAAGYNAGPGRAVAWRASRPIEGAVYAESIPFDETRDYVKQVMMATAQYSQRFGGSQQPLTQWLGVVAAAPAAPAASSARKPVSAK